MASIESKNLLVAVKAFARGNALPLDRDEVWESLSAAQAYVETPTAYAGQTIKVLVGEKYKTYVVQPQGDKLTLEPLGVEQEGVAYVQIVEELPVENQAQGVIYVNTTTNSGHIWTGSTYKEIFKDVSVEISELKESVEKKANLDGATFTGAVTLAADPQENLEAATKQYVDRLINGLTSNAPGVVGSENPLPSSYKAGESWRVVEAGTYADNVCKVGDLIIAVADGEEILAANFIVVQANIDGAVTGPASATDANIAIFDGATGKVLKDSNVTLASLQEALAKVHEHENKTVLDTFTKTETELLSEVDTKIAPIQKTLEGKAEADNVYVKTEVDSKLATITENLNSKISAAEVDSKIKESENQSLEAAKAYTDSRIGITGSTVREYIDTAIGAGGTDASEAVANALKEAKNYTDNSLTIQEF